LYGFFPINACLYHILWATIRGGGRRRGANVLKRKYFYDKKSKSYGAPINSGGAAAP